MGVGAAHAPVHGAVGRQDTEALSAPPSRSCHTSAAEMQGRPRTRLAGQEHVPARRDGVAARCCSQGLRADHGPQATNRRDVPCDLSVACREVENRGCMHGGGGAERGGRRVWGRGIGPLLAAELRGGKADWRGEMLARVVVGCMGACACTQDRPIEPLSKPAAPTVEQRECVCLAVAANHGPKLAWQSELSTAAASAAAAATVAAATSACSAFSGRLVAAGCVPASKGRVVGHVQISRAKSSQRPAGVSSHLQISRGRVGQSKARQGRQGVA